ncbi:outer membrane lipid asymmetry maintenance protein MlaD [Pseudomonas amygdali]|uniref:outer membrane lipid asymmetry maintenance protein MlaD n=1 Tax=Pseudomonas amygdali TaxID=47877 RepID=UPI001CD86353|nr:outer membrane lipid asymmetry maintenance protein MlaD [Pseudomonas amygdali]UBT80465.1 outer membrane lipid asymmetry maintenance protein MlaD [Pseudomonas amygdali]
MSLKRTETLVGLFVLLALTALVFLALKAANLASFEVGSTYSLTARFSNIGSLRPRAPVKSAGVRVGSVETIAFDPVRFQAVVTLAIDERYRFPTDSAAKILTSGLLGEQYIGLEPGGDDANMAGGGTLAQTQSAVVLENLIGQFLTGRGAEAGSQP